MRRLKSCDVFTAMRLIKAAGVKEEFERVALYVRQAGKLNVNELGAELIFSVIEGLASAGAEQKFYEFVSGPLEMSAEEVKEMELFDLIDMIKSYKDVEDPERLKAFFDSVAAIMR